MRGRWRRHDGGAGLLLRGGVKFFVVVVSDLNVGANADDADGVRYQVDVGSGGQPELVVDELLIEGEGAALAKRKEAEAGVDVAVKLRDETAHLAILFVDPEGAGGTESGLFSDVVRFGVRIAGKVEGDGAAAIHHFAAGGGNFGHGQDVADADALIALRGLPGRCSLGFVNLLHHLVLDFFLLIRVEVFAVLFDLAPNFVRVDEKDLEFHGLGLLHAAVFVQFLADLSFVEGVVLLNGFHLPLVLADLLDEGGNIGQRRVRRLRERDRRSAEGEGQRDGTKKPLQRARMAEAATQNIFR
jgi:hypothetical protein